MPLKIISDEKHIRNVYFNSFVCWKRIFCFYSAVAWTSHTIMQEKLIKKLFRKKWTTAVIVCEKLKQKIHAKWNLFRVHNKETNKE